MVHRDWTEGEAAKEVARIYAEENLDVLARARVMLSEPTATTLQQQLEQLPGALQHRQSATGRPNPGRPILELLPRAWADTVGSVSRGYGAGADLFWARPRLPGCYGVIAM